ncbi:MarR family winged helix-turn-helix transcriptional regulator [Achromobacter denitrificans]|uniref:MarR family transcriptional regulator n=1 Tax=Achromobacter denitrificans TaxID=32002 RepID=A0ABZ3FUE4_ACHDE|nr:MarR family transcriptional regulator [Achromobacter denitrificans]
MEGFDLPVRSADGVHALDDELESSIGFAIAEVSRVARRALYVRIAEYGVRGGSWYLLRVLWKADGLSQREIANKLGLTEPSVQEMLKAMEKDGLVSRERDLSDRRKIRVYLTDHARALQKPLLELSKELNAIILSGLTLEEQSNFTNYLLRISCRLTEHMERVSPSTISSVSLDLRAEVAGANGKKEQKQI